MSVCLGTLQMARNIVSFEVLHILAVHRFEKGLTAILSPQPTTEIADQPPGMRALVEKGRGLPRTSPSPASPCSTNAAGGFKNSGMRSKAQVTPMPQAR